MIKKIFIPIGIPFFLSIIPALILLSCGNDAINRQPCAESLPCLQPVVNACPNLTTGAWTSLGLEKENVSAVAVHPCNPGIIYAGTLRDFSAGKPGKLFKSTDCGAHWDTLAVGGSYRTIRFSPGNPDVIYAVNGGILKSNDGGQNWQRADEDIHIDGETKVSALTINPKNSCELYAGTGGFHGGKLYHSTNGGKNWSRIEGKGLEDLGNNMNRLDNGVTSLAMDPAHPNHIYVGTAQSGDVLHSADGGDTWELTGLKDTGSLVNALLVDPQNSGRIYAGLSDEGLHVSENGGSSWRLITNKFLADTTSVVELDDRNNILYVVTTHGDSGSLLAYHSSTGIMNKLSVPVANKSFYYSKLKIYESEYKRYIYFGLPAGIYARIDE